MACLHDSFECASITVEDLIDATILMALFCRLLLLENTIFWTRLTLSSFKLLELKFCMFTLKTRCSPGTKPPINCRSNNRFLDYLTIKHVFLFKFKLLFSNLF